MRVDLDAEGVAAESLPRFQQAPRQLRQLWRWAAASVALAAACAVLGFFIGLFAADSLWPPLLYNLGAAWLVLFAGLHAAYRVAAWRCVVLGAEASARPAWLRWQRGEPDAAADSAYERLLERLGQAIAHGLAQLGHAALWLAASAALALCLVAAGWRLDLPPASSGQAADLAIGICLLLAFAVLVLERRFASQGPAQWPEAPALGQLARALIGTLVLAALCLFLARQGHPWAPRLAVLLGLLPAALALELLGRAILAMFAPQRAGLEPRLVATSLLADLLRWPPRPLQRLQHELHQRFGIDLRQVWAFGFMRRAFLPVLAVVSLSGWLLSGVREIGMDARGVYERFGKPVAVLGPGLHLGLPWPLGRVLAVENGVVHELATSVAAGDGGASRSRPPKVRPRIAPTACGTPPTSARNRRSSPAWPTAGRASRSSTWTCASSTASLSTTRQRWRRPTAAPTCRRWCAAPPAAYWCMPSPRGPSMRSSASSARAWPSRSARPCRPISTASAAASRYWARRSRRSIRRPVRRTPTTRCRPRRSPHRR